MKVDSGDTAWLLVSTALVLFMTPGLALFYGGMVRRKNVLATIMHSFSALPIITLQWMLIGYSLAFGKSFHGIVGGLDLAGLSGLATEAKGTTPHLAFCAFQMMFAVITPALIAGAFAERIRFPAYVVFIPLAALLYALPAGPRLLPALVAGALLGLSAERLRNFFLRGTGANAGRIRVKPELARPIDFRVVNLMHTQWNLGEPFHMVFCRNVMIYFDAATQRKVLERIHRVMQPRGLLFVGHSENFTEAKDLFRLRGKTIYERV